MEFVDLKNQGIDPKVGKGTDDLTPAIIEGIERHAKNSCKELIQLMQINKRFVPKICTILSKRICEPSYTAE